MLFKNFSATIIESQLDATMSKRDRSSDEDDSSDDEHDPAIAAAEGETTSEPMLFTRPGEAYIYGNAKPAKTSDKRFSKQFKEPYTAASYLAALPLETAEITTYDARFTLWREELHAGFSLCFVGRGSKRGLLTRFAKRVLAKQGDIVSVNGYVPSLSSADILDAISSQVVRDEMPALRGQGERNEQRTRAICEHYAREDVKRLYLVINNIEGASLRPAKVRGMLARLAATPRIHFVTSFDHLRTPLLFPLSLASSRPMDEDEEPGESRTFNFLYHHTPTQVSLTFEPLIAGVPAMLFDEKVFERLAGAKGGRGTPAQRVAGAIAVLKSLKGDPHRIFARLALLQIQSGQPTTISKLADTLAMLKEEQLHTQMAEFLDHGMIEKEGTMLRLPYPKELLERILENGIKPEDYEESRQALGVRMLALTLLSLSSLAHSSISIILLYTLARMLIRPPSARLPLPLPSPRPFSLPLACRHELSARSPTWPPTTLASKKHSDASLPQY